VGVCTQRRGWVDRDYSFDSALIGQNITNS
jgi:hypothetical protein